MGEICELSEGRKSGIGWGGSMKTLGTGSGDRLIVLNAHSMPSSYPDLEASYLAVMDLPTVRIK